MALRLPSGMKAVNSLIGGWTVIVFLFLYFPIIVLIVYSFNATDMSHSATPTQWGGFTFRWYEQAFNDTRIARSVKNSLIVAAVTTLVATSIGTAAGWLLFRYSYRFARAVQTIILTPMIVPEVIIGVSLYLLFRNYLIGVGMTAVIVSHVTFCIPFVMVGIQARLSGLDPSMEEAAMDLGATPWQAFYLIITPYLLPAIISGAFLSFTLSMDELVVTWFVKDADLGTFPILVYDEAKKGPQGKLYAVSTVFIAATVVLVVIGELLRRRRA